MCTRMAVVSTGAWDSNFAVEIKDAVTLIDIVERANRVSIEYVNGSQVAVFKPSSEGCSMKILEVITPEEHSSRKEEQKMREEMA